MFSRFLPLSFLQSVNLFYVYNAFFYNSSNMVKLVSKLSINGPIFWSWGFKRFWYNVSLLLFGFIKPEVIHGALWYFWFVFFILTIGKQASYVFLNVSWNLSKVTLASFSSRTWFQYHTRHNTNRCNYVNARKKFGSTYPGPHAYSFLCYSVYKNGKTIADVKERDWRRLNFDFITEGKIS